MTFTLDGKSVMNQVDSICSTHRKFRIGSVHFLLAIIQVKSCKAHELLEKKIANLKPWEEACTGWVKYPDPIENEASFTESASRILKIAADKAQGPVSSEHLLIGLEETPDALSHRILRDAGYFGGKPKRVRESGKPRTGALEMFSYDLTQAAENGKLDPVHDRELEIERIIQVLGRKRKNNPVLIGDAGVGKTAIIEGLAQRIVQRNVPELLLNKKIFSLDLNALVSGTMFRGQFEERLQAVIADLKNNPDNIVFIDEIHGIVGSGGREGSGDTANVLKPYLARGDIRCIGATTSAEYRRHIESDSALERRFQKVYIEPPNEEETREIVLNSMFAYEDYHGLKIDPSAIDELIYLSARYITDKNFPDKAFDVIDEAGSLAKLEKLSQIDSSIIQRVIASITNIPVNQLSKRDRERLQTLEEDLNSEVIGQKEAVAELTRAVKRLRVQTSNIHKAPSFLFLGPTGVGKSFLAKVLAKKLFNSEKHFISFDMSEFSESFTISNLIGAPPGYVGYHEGGKLTEAVRRRPYSVVLFDEIEKAHPKIHNVLLQVLEDGHLTDASGRKVDFQNTILIMTGNIGARNLDRTTMGFGEETDKLEKKITKDLEDTFQPEFLNRVDNVIFFDRLTEEHVALIFNNMIRDLNPRIELLISDEVRNYCVKKSNPKKYGARSLRRVIQDEIEAPIADLLLTEDTKKVTITLVEGKIVTYGKFD